jgi:hypothetical protein
MKLLCTLRPGLLMTASSISLTILLPDSRVRYTHTNTHTHTLTYTRGCARVHARSLARTHALNEQFFLSQCT